MNLTYNAIKNMMSIFKVRGFYVEFKGDPSVGIQDSQWKIEEDFYFDNKEELEEFRNGIKNLFENLCGEIVSVMTYEEYDALLEDAERGYYSQNPVRYLIQSKDYGNKMYKQADCCASYAENVGEAIHTELPRWIPEEGDSEHEVYKSTDPEFKKILINEANDLENEINHLEQRLATKKRNLDLIMKELKYGQSKTKKN